MTNSPAFDDELTRSCPNPLVVHAGCNSAMGQEFPSASREIPVEVFMRRTGDVGAIAVGRYGDMVAVSGGALTDSRRLAHPDLFIKGVSGLHNSR